MSTLSQSQAVSMDIESPFDALPEQLLQPRVVIDDEDMLFAATLTSVRPVQQTPITIKHTTPRLPEYTRDGIPPSTPRPWAVSSR